MIPVYCVSNWGDRTLGIFGIALEVSPRTEVRSPGLKININFHSKLRVNLLKVFKFLTQKGFKIIKMEKINPLFSN
ncbi:hypothetical protein CEN44_10185 [Fischerella muscicola CCMEE 5323]|uniref:Uncharacterized protein n=1 Tax=Fischerella muscicola CCMEE 5323 TaxID=2019572 RepID=A0A2N6K466_FISMU|nr:hypothetical protein CEN44_10185 [Fischerella muscicola CCMEE 5323]